MLVDIRPAVGDNITQGVASGAQCRRINLCGKQKFFSFVLTRNDRDKFHFKISITVGKRVLNDKW